ncbi:MAG: hypothetical protein KBS77_04585 [Bacteroidales bacterium]|nr:hypothetical protein [Candidatus Colicola faecequi]
MFDFSKLEIPPTAEQIKLEESRDAAKESFDEIRQEMADMRTLLTHPELDHDDVCNLSNILPLIGENLSAARESFFEFSRLRRETISAVGPHDIHFINRPLQQALQDAQAVIDQTRVLQRKEAFAADNKILRMLYKIEVAVEEHQRQFGVIKREYDNLDNAINKCSEQEHGRRMMFSMDSLLKVITSSIDDTRESYFSHVLGFSPRPKIEISFSNPISKIVAGCNTKENCIARQKDILERMSEILPDFDANKARDWNSFACSIHKHKLGFRAVNELFIGLSAWQILNELKDTSPSQRKKAGRTAEEFFDYISFDDFRRSFAERVAAKNKKMNIVRFAACYLISLFGTSYAGFIPSYLQRLAECFKEFASVKLRTMQRHVSKVVEWLYKFQDKCCCNCSTKIENQFHMVKEAIENIRNCFKKYQIAYVGDI